MSQTIIPLQFEHYLQGKISASAAPDMNEMIFAFIPELDLASPINRDQGLPDAATWVHQQDIDQVGKVGGNALAYSVVILGTVPAFTFNAIYMHDKNVPNSCGMIVFKATETKEVGMASTKSLLQTYAGAAHIAGITVDAQTWQIDYQSRLIGIEDDHRLACLDIYGHAAFIDGFEVTQESDPTKYKITAGVVYIGGLRALLDNDVIQTITTKPTHIYLDVVRTGTALSTWENRLIIVVTPADLNDYIDSHEQPHYVTKLASINRDGLMIDKRLWRAPLSLKSGRNLIVDGRFDYWLEKDSHSIFFGNYGSATMWGLKVRLVSRLTMHKERGVAHDLPFTDNPSAKYFNRVTVGVKVGSGNDNNARMFHNIEYVTTLAGKKAVLSFYAKADSALHISAELTQVFGSGGSPDVNLKPTKISVSTGWARYEVTIDIPDVIGKTINQADSALSLSLWYSASSNYDARTDSLGIQEGTFDIACVQLEEGGMATKFEEERPKEALSRVGRYYQKYSQNFIIISGATSISQNYLQSQTYIQQMRASPVVMIGKVYKSGGFSGSANAVTSANDSFLTARVTASSTSVMGAWNAAFSLDARL